MDRSTAQSKRGFGMARMAAICAPSLRQWFGPREQQHQPSRARDCADTKIAFAAFGMWQVIVAEDHTAAARQCLEARPQCIAKPWIGEQPKAREQLGVAAAHIAFYSAAMEYDETQAAARLEAINAAIAAAARRAGRAPQSVTLIAVSKTHPASAITPLIAAGQRIFGENRVQEAAEKWPALRALTPDIELHMVGQLQSNKAEQAVALFDAIHSVDRLSLVAAIGRAQAQSGRVPRCFLQVNIGDEPQKGGCAIADLPTLLTAARAAALDIAGLMAVPPEGVEAAPYFALLAKLARDHGLTGLSMGMTSDFETAVMLGATHVRIGSALFGARG